MNKNTIEYLAYLLDKAKNEGIERAIVFIGAGMSVTAGIPLTEVIVRHIKLKFLKNPLIRDYQLIGTKDYYNLMGMLTADERRDLFHFYVTRDKVKLNIANIYLAQLLNLGYVDYIVTVNFDDLILKASTLYNSLPPVYDLSDIKTVTTTDIRTKSVIYLHGQYFGQWLLNNKEELKKVENEVLSFFNSIKTRRTWITIGYSGNDGIFEKIKSLGCFSNEFFWVQNELKDKHIKDFINSPNNNVNTINGYYADSFFLKLHAELGKLNQELNPPKIFHKPFSFLKSMMQNVSEIKENDELYQEVKEQVNICNNRIDKAINTLEKTETIEDFKQKMIDASIKNNFSEEQAQMFENKIKKKGYNQAIEQLAWYYNDWGIKFFNEAKLKDNAEIFQKSIVKFEKSINLNSKDHEVYTNYGSALFKLAKLTNNDSILHKSIEQSKKAIKLKPDNSNAYMNWGNSLSNLADKTKEKKLFLDCFNKYEKAVLIDPNDFMAYYNWGFSLYSLSKITNNKKHYQQCVEKYEKSISINPKYYYAYKGLGDHYGELAVISKDSETFQKSFDNYKMAIEINPKKDETYFNFGCSLLNFYKLTKDQNSLEKAKKILIKGHKLGGNPYNLSCCYSFLNDKENTLKYLKETLDKHLTTLKQIEEEEDFNFFREDKDFKKLLTQYSEK